MNPADVRHKWLQHGLRRHFWRTFCNCNSFGPKQLRSAQKCSAKIRGIMADKLKIISRLADKGYVDINQ
jgi:hypothetical protein